MRLFVTEDLTAGFAIKGDDMIRAFNDPKSDYSSIATAFILEGSQHQAALADAGWQCLVIWECETSDLIELERKLSDFLCAAPWLACCTHIYYVWIINSSTIDSPNSLWFNSCCGLSIYAKSLFHSHNRKGQYAN
jgi:hypothetical protein